MHWCNRWFALLAVVSALFAFSCAGSGSAPQVSDSGNITAIEGLTGLPLIPQDSGSADRTVAAGEGSSTVLGKDFIDELNGTVDGNALHLDAPAGEGEGHFAYGLYKVGGLAGKQARSLFVECAPALEEEFFVGVADYSGGHWDWFGPCALPEFEINLSESGHRYVTELGNFYFIVLCHQGNSATHFQSTLFYGEDEGHAPGMPTELWASDGAYPFGVMLEWNPGAGAAYYEVFRRTDGSEGEFAKVGVSESNHYFDEAVEPGVYYIYKVRSVNEFGASDFSNHDSGFASGEGGDGWCPGDLWASDGLYVEKVRLEWHPGTGDGWFHVYRRAANTEDWTVLGEVETNSFNDTTAEPNQVYVYKVVKSGIERDDCASNQDEGFRSGESGCNIDVYATDGAFGDKVVVEWQSAGEGVWYDVLRKRHGVEEDYQFISGETQDTRFEDLEVEPGVVYQYKIRVYIEGGACDTAPDTGYAEGGGGGEDWCPTSLIATDGLYTDKVRLEWLPGGGDVYYFKVYRRPVGSEVWDMIGSTEFSDYNDFTAEPGVNYVYKVVKHSEMHEACESNWDTGFRAEGQGDWCPGDLFATDGTYAEKVRLEWAPGGGDAYWFKVYRALPEGDWVFLSETDGPSYDDFAVDPGVVYHYKVVKFANDHNECATNIDPGHAGSLD